MDICSIHHANSGHIVIERILVGIKIIYSQINIIFCREIVVDYDLLCKVERFIILNQLTCISIEWIVTIPGGTDPESTITQ